MLQRLARINRPLVIWAGILSAVGRSIQAWRSIQAGALLAAAIVLLHLSGLWPGWKPIMMAAPAAPSVVFRLSCGFRCNDGFGALLEYPQAHAGLLILLIESESDGVAGVTLLGLFLFLSRDTGRPPVISSSILFAVTGIALFAMGAAGVIMRNNLLRRIWPLI